MYLLSDYDKRLNAIGGPGEILVYVLPLAACARCAD